MAVDAFAIGEHFEVLGADGMHVGEVDHVEEGRLKLTRRDSEAGGKHHFLPLDAVAKVVADERKVFLSLNKSDAEALWDEAD